MSAKKTVLQPKTATTLRLRRSRREQASKTVFLRIHIMLSAQGLCRCKIGHQITRQSQKMCPHRQPQRRHPQAALKNAPKYVERDLVRAAVSRNPQWIASPIGR